MKFIVMPFLMALQAMNIKSMLVARVLNNSITILSLGNTMLIFMITLHLLQGLQLIVQINSNFISNDYHLIRFWISYKCDISF